MDISIHPLLASDLPGVLSMLERIKEFSTADSAVAVELLDIYLHKEGQKDYHFLAACGEDGVLIGFACYGPTPLTTGTYDLYWIAVDPSCAGKGVGTGLLRGIETILRQAGGRLVIIETSSDPIYTAAQRLYLKNGYHLGERIADFYRDGEDRLTFVKDLRNQ